MVISTDVEKKCLMKLSTHHYNTSHQTKYRSKLPQSDEGDIKKFLQLTTYAKEKKLDAFFLTLKVCMLTLNITIYTIQKIKISVLWQEK